MIKRAENFEGLENGFVKCKLCQKMCVLKDGEEGACRVRVNYNGTLYSISYGILSTQSIQPIEKVLYHFYPGTKTFAISSVGCTFNCLWCQNFGISQAKQASTITYEMTAQDVVDSAKRYGVNTISFVNNEPIVWYEFVKDVSKIGKESGMKNILFTNGYITLDALKDLVKYVDAVNLDIKGFSEELYQKYCNGTLAPVLDAAKYLIENKVHLELTYLIVPLINDSLEEIGKFVDWVRDQLNSSVPIHFARFFPAYKFQDRPPTPADTLMAAANLAYEHGLEYVYVKNVYFEGLEDTHCPRCHIQLISRHNFNISNINLTSKNECPNCGLKIPIVGKPSI
ncbi:MAG: AmmeMemoRadiSam system radical SAM enzyme [Nitrososphaeria archaeon]|nr:AmmeMemoRadiSam system radical SAM enzyme [Nitrososphaeria archaeon]